MSNISSEYVPLTSRSSVALLFLDEPVSAERTGGRSVYCRRFLGREGSLVLGCACTLQLFSVRQAR